MNYSYCPQCGYKNDEDAMFCVNCGITLNSQNSQDFGISNDMVTFMGRNAYYYVRKFSSIKTRKKAISWNWAAFFFGPAWLIYRKLYISSITLLTIQFVGRILLKVPMIETVIMILIGLFGNYYYMNYVERELKKAHNIPEIEKYAQYFHKGATNSIAAGILCFVSILMSIYVEIMKL